MSLETPAVGRGRAGRDIAGQLGFRALNLVLGVFVVALVVRTLGDEGFGQWATIMATIGLVSYFGSHGFDRVAVERASAEPEAAARWVGSLITIRLALSVPITVAAAVICVVLAEKTEMRIAAIALSTLIVLGALNASKAVFQLQVRNARVSAIEVGSGIVWGVVVVVVALLDGGIVAMAFAFVAVTGATNLLYLHLARRAAPIDFSGTRERWGELWRLSLPVGIAAVLVFGYGHIDQLLVFEMAGAEEAGLYGAVYRILERIQFVPSTLLVTLYPILLAARSDPERLRRVLQLSLDYLVIGALPAVAITIAGAEPLTRLLFGAEFAEAAPALPVLMGAFTVISVGYLAGYLVTAYQLQARFAWVALGALVFNVVGNLLLIPEWGFMGAAWMTLATELVVNAAALWLVFSRMPVRPGLGRVGAATACAALMGLAVWGAREAGVPLGAWLPGGLALYVTLLFAGRVVRAEELRALVERRIP